MPSNGAVEEIRTPAPQIRSLVLKSQFFSLNAAISRGGECPLRVAGGLAGTRNIRGTIAKRGGEAAKEV